MEGCYLGDYKDCYEEYGMYCTPNTLRNIKDMVTYKDRFYRYANCGGFHTIMINHQQFHLDCIILNKWGNLFIGQKQHVNRVSISKKGGNL